MTGKLIEKRSQREELYDDNKFNEPLKHFVDQSLIDNPKERPNCPQLIRSDWLTSWINQKKEKKLILKNKKFQMKFYKIKDYL